MRYKVEVGSFCTRYVKRTVTIHANSETEASEKAINKFIDKEMQLVSSVDPGTPQVDCIELVNS